MYAYSGGHLKLYEPMIDQVTTIKKASAVRELPDAGVWRQRQGTGREVGHQVRRPRDVDGVKTEKLELVAKDPKVRKNLPKVTIWIDTTRGVSLKQVFDEGQGSIARSAHYFNIKIESAAARRCIYVQDR